MTEGCGLCGGELDDHGVRVTLAFAAGLRNGNQTITVPWKLADWPLCWACFTSDGCKVLRAALADEYIEPVMPGTREACRAVCAGGRLEVRRGLRGVFSLRQGSRGLPDSAKCPVCYGPCQVEKAA